MEEEFVNIKTTKFLVEADEEQEIINEGMYGASLSKYIVSQLDNLNYSAGALVEDWGYLVSASKNDADMKIGIYCGERQKADSKEMKFSVCVFLNKTKRSLGSWWKFKSISIEPELNQLRLDIQQILANAPQTTIKNISLGGPE